MKVLKIAYLALMFTTALKAYTNLQVFNAEVDREFRNFLQGRNLNDKQQRDRYLKQIAEEKKTERKLPGMNLQDLVDTLLKETDPDQYQPKVLSLSSGEETSSEDHTQKVVQNLKMNQQVKQQIKQVQTRQPVAIEQSQNKDNILNLFEELLGKGNWTGNQSKAKDNAASEDDSEDQENNDHWQKYHEKKNKSCDDNVDHIPVDHSMFRINQQPQKRPAHMVNNQKIFDAQSHGDSFNTADIPLVSEQHLSDQQLKQMISKLSYYENILKLENEASQKTKNSILVLLQQISNQFHLPQQFQKDIKMLFEEKGLETSSEEESQNSEQDLEKDKMNQILDLIGFKNLADRGQNNLRNNQPQQKSQNNPFSIQKDVDDILNQLLKKKQQSSQQQPLLKQNQQNPQLSQQLFQDPLNQSNKMLPQQMKRNRLNNTPNLIPLNQNPSQNMLNKSPFQNLQNRSPFSNLPNVQNINPFQNLQNIQNRNPLQNLPNFQNRNSLQNLQNAQNNNPYQNVQNLQNRNPFQNLLDPQIKNLPQNFQNTLKDNSPQNLQDSLNINPFQKLQDAQNKIPPQDLQNIQNRNPLLKIPDLQNNNPFQNLQQKTSSNQQNPKMKQYLDQEAPVAYKDDQRNVIELNNQANEQQIKNIQNNTTQNENQTINNKKEQMHHFTITFDDQDKGTKKTYKINCMKGNCENEEKDSPFDIQYHSPNLRLI